MHFDSTESQQLSPTRNQVDEYIRLLEKQTFRNSFGARLVRLKENRHGGNSGLSIWGILLYWPITVVLTFFARLVRIIFESGESLE